MSQTGDLPPDEVTSAPAANRAGKYVCTLKLGAGAMGEVWKAWDLELRRWVALKFMKGADADLLARFRREAQVAARFTHPNIAAIYDVGGAKSRPYIAMQFVEGRTLKHADRGDRRQVVRQLRDAARAVHHAHERGVIHRDLKPENLMVEGDRVMVMDFGLARPVESDSSLSLPGTVVGTPSYMSPEQARGGELGPASDVWSLGATLYDRLSGRPPFRGANVYDTLRLVAEADPAPATDDRDLENIVRRCLEKDPRDRYPTAEDLAADLDRWLEGEPVQARGSTITYRLRKKLAKRKGLVVAATAAAAVLALAVVLLVRTRGENRELVLAQLRESSELNLAAALELRRSGSLEGMDKFARKLEEACAKAEAALPREPEPNYRRGRLLRARMDDEAAAAEQEKALAKDPGYLPARYERVVLASKAHRARVAALVARAESPGGVPDPAKLAEADPVARDLKERMAKDLEAILANPAGLEPAQVEGAKGLAAWARGDEAEAASRLAKAVELEEAVEALAAIEERARRWPEAVAWWTKGIERDRGYRPFLSGRLQARILQAGWIRTLGEDPSPVLAAAVADADELIRRYPADPEGWRQRGRAHAVRQHAEGLRGRDTSEAYRDALRDLARAVELAPSDPEPLRTRGNVRNYRAVLERDAGRPMDEASAGAIEDFNAAAKLAPKDAKIRSDLAAALLNYGSWKSRAGRDPREQFEAAFGALDAALELQPGMVEARRQRGIARVTWGQHLRRLGEDPGPQFRKGQEDLDEVVKREPKDPDGWAYRGLLHGERASGSGKDEDYAASVADLGEAIRLAPGRVDLYRHRATALLNWAKDRAAGEPRLVEALKDLDVAVQGDPAAADYRHLRGTVRAALGRRRNDRGEDAEEDYRAAAADFEKAIELNPRSEEAWIALGVLHLDRSQAEKRKGRPRAAALAAAVEAARKAVALNEASGRAWSLLGEAKFFEAEDATDGLPALRESLRAYDEALRRDAGQVDAWMDRGRSHMHVAVRLMGRGEDPGFAFQQAAKDLEKAVEMAPGRGRAWSELGSVRYNTAYWLRGLKRPDVALLRSAVEAFEKALGLGKAERSDLEGAASACLLLGVTLREQGRAEAPPLKRTLELYRKLKAMDPSLEAKLARNTATCEQLLGELGE